MEGLDLSALTLWSVLSGAAVILFYAFLVWPYDIFKKQGLKGPKPLPVVGTILPFFKTSMVEVDMKNTKLYGKVYGAFNGRTPILVVSDPDMVKDILVKEFNCFVNRTSFKSIQQKPLDRMMTAITDDHWRHVRSSLSPAYSSGKLKQMLPTITNCVKHLVDYIDEHHQQPIATKEILSGYAMDVISGTAFGLDTRSLEQPDNPFLKSAKEFINFANIRNPKRMAALIGTLLSPKLGVVLSKLGLRAFDPSSVEYIEGVVRTALHGHNNGGKDRQDFVHLCLEELVDMKTVSSDTVKTTDDGLVWTTQGLTEDDIISNSIVFLIAGYDTVSTFLSFFCYAMATNPEAQQKVYEEIAEQIGQADLTYEKLKDLGYLDMCMDETLRMYPPALRLDRKCNKTTTIGGVTITQGMTVNIVVYAMHHDSDYWEDPFTFTPERFTPEAKAKIHPFIYLPFGAGPRNCIGMRLALLEAKAAIVNLLSKYEIRTCKETEKPPLKFGVSFGLISPAEPIKLVFCKRQAPS